jgi:hypothetical protein
MQAESDFDGHNGRRGCAISSKFGGSELPSFDGVKSAFIKTVSKKLDGPDLFCFAGP